MKGMQPTRQQKQMTAAQALVGVTDRQLAVRGVVCGFFLLGSERGGRRGNWKVREGIGRGEGRKGAYIVVFPLT